MSDIVDLLREESTRYRREWQRECADTDGMLQLLGLCPSEYRSEGGSLLLTRVQHTLRKQRAAHEADNERLRHLNRALLAVARRYAPVRHAFSCATVYDAGVECNCGFSAAHATIDAALGTRTDQPPGVAK